MTTELSDVVINCSKHVLLDDVSMLSSSFQGLSLEQRAMKRILDLVISSLMILVTSPIMLIEAIAIKLCDHGPVLYKQERLTRDGEIFKVCKFRTMRVDAEKAGNAQLAKKDDDRITPVGKILRKTRMDELPQLFNVFRGEMSLVGPRPERPSIAAEYYKDIPEFKFRLRAKAGLTGLAQIQGKYNTTPRDKLMLDLMYIERYSIWEDIMIIFQTLMVFFKSDSTEGFDDTDHTQFEAVKDDEIV
jgi:exopolysaccharide biosynthesis polyprenyl glycosylphosphotransferase